ncbi:30S ribosomal protein S4 [soil metagenome]
MSRYTGSKNKLARRVGEDLGLKTNAAKVAKVIANRPGQHGAKGRKKLSDYGVQLKEKQKVKYIYGVSEKQLRALYDKATKNPTATGAALLGLLERRLDNVIYRLGWSPTRASARQAVAHSHVQVNGKKMNIPSYTVKVSDVITVKSTSVELSFLSEGIKNSTRELPAWLEKKGGAANISRLPERKEIKEAIEEQLIVEFYSR